MIIQYKKLGEDEYKTVECDMFKYHEDLNLVCMSLDCSNHISNYIDEKYVSEVKVISIKRTPELDGDE